MTEVVSTPHVPTKGVIGTGAVVEGSAPVLITEQQLKFASAAVLPKSRRGVVSWLRAIKGLFTSTKDAAGSDGDQRKSSYVAKRYAYIENAAMSREMDRL